MTRIKNIIFDFGGVLVDWNPRYLYRNYFADENAMEDFLDRICTNAWNMEQDRGRPLAEGTRVLLEEYPEYRDLIAAYYGEWEKMLKSDVPETVALLRELKAAGYPLYGLTNWSAETIPVAYARFPFFALFDGIVVSGSEKTAKPEPRIYRILLERYGLKAEECLFIDDNPANIETARGLGFRTVLFRDPAAVRGQVMRELGK